LVKVLFICTGNICRSPTAEGVFRALVEANNLSHAIEIDSVGTGSWHVGKPPDERSQEAAARRGYDISDLRARLIDSKDILNADYLIAMDTANMDALRMMVPQNLRSKLKRFLEFSIEDDYTDVPDPYYDGLEGFDLVLDLVEEASKDLLFHIQNTDL